MSPRQAVLDPRLALDKPVQRFVGLTLLHLTQAQNRTQAGGRRLLIHRPHKTEFGARRNQPVNHHRNHQIAMAPRCRILRRAQDQPVQGYFAERPERRRNMAVRQRTLDLQFLRPGTEHRSALEQRLQGVDHVPRQLAQIGQGPLLRAALRVAIALPQQNRRRRGPIRYRLDEHSRIESHSGRFGNLEGSVRSAGAR